MCAQVSPPQLLELLFLTVNLILPHEEIFIMYYIQPYIYYLAIYIYPQLLISEIVFLEL